MKPLAQLNNVEKAKLLFQLFPEEIPAFLAFQKAATENLLRDPDQLKDERDNAFFTIEFWVKIAADTNKVLDKYKIRLAKRSRLFANQLFDRYTALYSTHCLKKYIKHKIVTDLKFKAFVELLFA